jgi:glutamine synthetase
MTPEQAIAHFSLQLQETHRLTPVLAAELECYVTLGQSDPKHFWEAVALAARHAKVPLMRIERERGKNQYELVLLPMREPRALAHALATAKQLVQTEAEKIGAQTSFDAKPYVAQPGSALHLHLHLEDTTGENPFTKSEETISPTLTHSMAGVLALTRHVMPVLYVDARDYARLEETQHVPQTVSWGVNNRTCAVRIPGSFAWEPKRIEWRVAGANANPYAVVALILAGVSAGLVHRMTLPAQTHGIAAKASGAEFLPDTAEKAMEAMRALPETFAPLTPAQLEEWLAA